ILDFYTNFGEGASNEEIYKMLCESDLIEVLERHISPVQLRSIRAAIDKKVEYRLQHALRQGEWSGLAADLRDFLAKYEKKFSRSFKPKIMSQAMENLAKMEVSEQGLIDALTAKAQTQKTAAKESAGKTDA
ncbi:MAG: hypothetical protein LIO46_04200, partial [Clostridiales bacterium]|nr:hypothetical protein [Clostridiales bacterium]